MEGLGPVGFVLQTLCCHKRDTLGLSKGSSCGQWSGAGAWWPHLSESVLVAVPKLTNIWRNWWCGELGSALLCPGTPVRACAGFGALQTVLQWPLPWWCHLV